MTPAKQRPFDEELVRLRDMRAMMYLLRFAKESRGLFTIALLFLTLSSIAGVLSARTLGSLAQDGLIKGQLRQSVLFGTAIIFLEVASIVFTYYGRRILSQASLASVLRVRAALFEHLEALPMKFFDTQPQGRIVTRVTHDVETMESFFSQTLARLLNAIISLVVVLTAMLLLDIKVGLALAAAMIPALIVTWSVRNPVRHWNREFAIRNSAINAKLSEFLNGLPVIRALGIEDWSKKDFDLTIEHHLESAVRINRLNSWSRPLIMFLTSLPLALFIGFGGYGVIGGTLSLAVYISFIRLSERFLQPMNVISQEIHVVQTALANTERVASFLMNATEKDELGTEDTLQPDTLRGEIEFKHVHMSYDSTKFVLKDVSFTIKAGEKIGLAGRTGSGKTSTLALLSRLYEFQDGELRVDGMDIRKIHRERLRRAIGVVNQEAIVFEASLRENLLAGSELPEAEVLEACRTTGFARVMQANALTLDSIIYDQGANLSAGERQLLSLTRILIKDPSILILDEATANIDPDYERLVHEAVEKVMLGRTCFIIAHRLDTLKACNRLLVFRDGQLVEDGALDVLLANPNSYYKQLYDNSKKQEEPVLSS
ncbi:MAG: ABC transporter ATP-binding protein [Bdellovibrionota bacterium]